MKITKSRILQIINEEVDAMQNNRCGFHDDEGNMALRQIDIIQEYAQELKQMIQPDMELESWVQAKITLAQDYISKVKHYLEGEISPQQGVDLEKD